MKESTRKKDMSKADKAKNINNTVSAETNGINTDVLDSTIAKPAGKWYKKKVEHWQVIAMFLMVYDVVVAIMSYLVVLWIRFDCSISNIPSRYMDAAKAFLPIYALITLIVFYGTRLYRSIWRFASYRELMSSTIGVAICGILHIFLITAFFTRMPITYYIFGWMVQYIAVVGIRFSYRFVRLIRKGQYVDEDGNVEDVKRKKVMIVGAGAAGAMIIRDIERARELRYKVCCFIDDNSNKWGRFVEGIPVVGGRDDILRYVDKYDIDKIFIALPSATAVQRRDIISICKESGCELKSIPGMYQLLNGDVRVSNLKDVSVEDLLGREVISADMSEVYNFINGKVVLVTGGGGSIGSELCRQVAKHDPKMLIIFDVYENNAYNIQIELREKYPDLDLKVLIGSVRDSRKIFDVFSTYHPDIVYHAAAHKHVPLMEDSPCEAIKNNAIGTYKTAYAAMVHGCEKFVLISTDKAVNPTNIMGASKRLCEMIIQSFDKLIKENQADKIKQYYTHSGFENADKDGTGRVFNDIKTDFVAVRFGNVLGSNGSVIPLFKKQIASGGPVTVTHPDIIRYFMTIPEAVSLVMLAGTYAKGGEIFVLEMGSPVKIDDLARNLIKLSGYRPDIDIKVEYTGLRPGEKLYEEMLLSEEGTVEDTENKLIHIGKPMPFDSFEFLDGIDDLMKVAYLNRDDKIIEMVKRMVSTYHPKRAGR